MTSTCQTANPHPCTGKTGQEITEDLKRTYADMLKRQKEDDEKIRAELEKLDTHSLIRLNHMVFMILQKREPFFNPFAK